MTHDQAALYSKQIDLLKQSALRLASAGFNMSKAIKEFVDQGEPIDLHKEAAFITGAHARLLRDLGTIEALQELSARPTVKHRQR